MPLSNLPGIRVTKLDGNLKPEPIAAAPRALIIGTAAKGLSRTPYFVQKSSTAKSEFGTDGTLIRGMYEAQRGGAQEVVLYRIGGSAAILTGVGDSSGSAGYTIETVMNDDAAGAAYSVWYDDSADRLVVYRVSDGIAVYDNSSSTPIDRGEVYVSGFRASGGGTDIGTSSVPVALSSVDPSAIAGTSFTAGTDGTSLSRMELYEELYKAYKDLLVTEFDVVIPMDIYLDDLNTKAQGNPRGATTPVATAGTYPVAYAYTPGSEIDSLGRVYVEEYMGQYYFWWVFAASGFTAADVYPSVGSASATKKIDGTDLVESDFHEVNFGYQMARFLYEYSTDIVDATGVIGVLPPEGNSLTSKANWYGKEPTLTLNTSTGAYTVSANGSGLLGNKFMVGRTDHRGGKEGGGFILTDGEFMDGTEETDANNIPVDLGKYISVVIDYPNVFTGYLSEKYNATWAAIYGGYYINLPPESSPTNKVVPNMDIVYKLNLQTLDKLTRWGYVTLRQRPSGVTVTDAATAAYKATDFVSDWTRLSTVRISKALVDAVRDVLDPYIGEGVSESKRIAMKNVVENVLLAAKTAGYIQSYQEFVIEQTPDMEVAGTANIELSVVPAFELRRVNLTFSVSKSG